jgi:hypothetical protein
VVALWEVAAVSDNLQLKQILDHQEKNMQNNFLRLKKWVLMMRTLSFRFWSRLEEMYNSL